MKTQRPELAPDSVDALQKRELEQRDFLENAAIAMHWVAEDGTILWANAAELRLLGYSREEYVGRNIADFHADEPAIADILNRLRNDEKLDGYAARLRRKDGSIRHVAIYSSVYREDGRFIHSRCITLDITEQKQMPELQERLSAIVEFSEDAIISKDLNGVIKSWNNAAERLFGYTSEEVVGKPITIIIPPDRLSEEPEILRRLQRGERVQHFETIRRRKDGGLLNISLTISPVRDAEGKITGASKIARDITERKRSEEAIQALNRQLSADVLAMARMQQLSTRLVQAEDISQLLDEITAAGAEITGADMGNIQLLEDDTLKIVSQRGFDTPFLDYFNSAGRELVVAAEILKRGERVIVEDLVESPLFRGKQALDVMLAAGVHALQSTPLISRSGHLLGMLSTHYRAPQRPGPRELRMLDVLARQAADLIERKRAESALLTSEARFRQLADSMPQIVWTARPDGSADYYNERWYEFTGFSRERFGDESYETILHPDDVKHCHDTWYSAVRDGTPYRIEYRFWDRHHNRWRWFMGSALPARDSDGRIVKWFGSCTDIDDQKRIEEELRRTNLDLEQFAYSASHDLQEPLRTIKIYSELLTQRCSGQILGEGLEFLNFIREGASRMEVLVRDLLAYTQVTKVDLPHEKADANEALTAALANLTGAIAESGADITSDPLPCLRVLPTHFKQLFQNLIGNAIKYRSKDRTPKVHVTAEQHGELWVFSVRDNGLGIEPEYKDQVFLLFKRLHAAAEYSGTGLGLAICQRIVELYRGRIWVESELGQGSTFLFTIPN